MRKRKVVTREAEHSDIDKLAEFYSRCFPDHQRLNNLEYWKWKYASTHLESCSIPFLVLADEHCIYGGVGVVSNSMQVHDTVIQACHASDLFVDPEFKGLPAAQLWRSNHNRHSHFVESYVSDDGERICKAGGFEDLNTSVRTYFYPVGAHKSSGSLSKAISSLLKQLIRQVLASIVRIRGVLTANSGTTECITAEQLTADDIPSEKQQRITGRIGYLKDWNYIKWRYIDSPTLDCVFFVRKINGNPICLVVAHRNNDSNSLTILDVIRTSDESLDCAITLLTVIRFTKELGRRFVSTTILSKQLHKVFSTLGFSNSMSTNRFLFYSKDESVMSAFRRSGDWDFQLGDTDVL